MGVQGGYVTYRVNTQTSMPSYPRSGSAVRRRFRDFVVSAVLHCHVPSKENPCSAKATCKHGILSSLACRDCRSAGYARVLCLHAEPELPTHWLLAPSSCRLPPECQHLIAAGAGGPAEDNASRLLHSPAAGEEPCRGPAGQRRLCGGGGAPRCSTTWSSWRRTRSSASLRCSCALMKTRKSMSSWP